MNCIQTRACFRFSRSVKNGFRNFSISGYANSAYSSPLADTFYNDEQKEMQKTVFKIIENDVNPSAAEWERKAEYPAHEIFKKFGNAGLLGIDKPVEYGGLGLNFKYLAAVLEAMGAMKIGGVAMGLAVHMSMSQQILARYGSDYVRQEFLAPSIAGDFIACLAVSEPSAGSDVANIKTTAVRDGDDFIINGQKMWITNGINADWSCMLVNTSKASSYKNKSLICVPLNAKGVSRTKIEKMGNHSSDTAQIFLEDVRVPVKNVIGDEGAGFFYQMLQFQEERLAACVGCLLGMDKLISETIEYTRARQAFGKSILDNQVVHFRIAELATEIEALRALTYQAIDTYVSGEDVTRLASMAKLKAGRLVREVGDSCLQYWGGMGYTREVPASQFYLDSRLLSIGGGVDEIMLEIICKLMNISPRGVKK